MAKNDMEVIVYLNDPLKLEGCITDGRFASILGYDAIHTHVNTYVVLNRGKVVMKNEKNSGRGHVKRSGR